MRGDYEYRVAHIDARPPRTYAAALQISVRIPGATFTLAAPIARVAAVGGGAMRFEHISAERQEQFVSAQHEIRQVQLDRRNSEIQASAQARASGGQPVRMNIHTSTMTTAREMPGGAARAGAVRATTGGEMLPGRNTAPAAAAPGRMIVPNGTTPRTGTATSRSPDNSKKSRDQRDKDNDKGSR